MLPASFYIRLALKKKIFQIHPKQNKSKGSVIVFVVTAGLGGRKMHIILVINNIITRMAYTSHYPNINSGAMPTSHFAQLFFH